MQKMFGLFSLSQGMTICNLDLIELTLKVATLRAMISLGNFKQKVLGYLKTLNKFMPSYLYCQKCFKETFL